MMDRQTDKVTLLAPDWAKSTLRMLLDSKYSVRKLFGADDDAYPMDH